VTDTGNTSTKDSVTESGPCHIDAVRAEALCVAHVGPQDRLTGDELRHIIVGVERELGFGGVGAAAFELLTSEPRMFGQRMSWAKSQVAALWPHRVSAA
jgi:hypothetical protein